MCVKKFFAEFIGTFGFVFIGCGSAVFAAPWIGYLGIAVAFGLGLTAMMYAFSSVSGGFFNPAVTLAVTVAGKTEQTVWWKRILNFIGYIAAQTAGACAAAYMLYFLYSGKTGFVNTGGFAANVVERYTLETAFWMETVLSFLFICVFLGSKAYRDRKGVAPVAVGLMLTAVYLISMPVTRGGINPARATSQAVFGCDETAVKQLWLFWAAPMLGGFIAGLIYNKRLASLFSFKNEA